MIDSLFEILFLKNIGMTCLIFIIMMLRPFVLKHLNAKVAYGLWAILPIYLLMPINTAEINSSVGLMTFVLGDSRSGQLFQHESTIFANKTLLVTMLIWGSGCLVTLFSFLSRYWRLKNSLDEREFDSFTEGCLRSSGLVRVVSSSLVDTPAIFGFFQAYLVLPERFAELPSRSQQMILQHELFHLRRSDHRINFLRVFIKSLFWFNPLFYWADKYCEADQEISCDFGVLKNSNTENRTAYANALLVTVTQTQQFKLLSQWQYQSLIKERVKMLNSIKSKQWHTWLGVALAASSVWGTSSVVIAESDKFSNLEAIPTNIVQPRYPRSAAVNGVEGWVKYSFNVDSNGQPYEIELIDANPQGVFEKDALKAVTQWKFEQNRSQQGLVYTMEFVLE